MVSATSSLPNVPADENVVSNAGTGADLGHPGRGPSAIPEDKKTEILENLEDDWQDDPENPRNWSVSRKWASAAIVRAIRLFDASMLMLVLQVSLYTFVSPLTSSIMAPGLPEIATKYDIHSETLIAMTLSIFLISFGVAVSRANSKRTRK